MCCVDIIDNVSHVNMLILLTSLITCQLTTHGLTTCGYCSHMDGVDIDNMHVEFVNTWISYVHII